VQKEYDVVVVGGGAGGVGAAMGAARENVSVLLVERYGFLGGEATGGLVNTFMPYKLGQENLTNPAFDEIELRLEAAHALTSDETLGPDRKTFDEEALKLVLDQVMQDYGVDVLLHSFFGDLEMSGSRIQRIHTYGKSGRIAVSGRVYIDGTGDGDLAARAGAPFEIGRPGDGLCQPMTTYFQVGGIPPDAWIPDLKQELVEIIAEAKSTGELEEPYDNVHIHRCVDPRVYAIQCNHVVGLSGTDTEDLTVAEQLGRQQVHALYRIFRRLSPHFREARLLKTGVHIGVRETRRVLGEYVLTAEDAIHAIKFADGIARSKNSASLHNPEGPHRGSRVRVPAGAYYEIPYRCLVPQAVDNLLLGSRCLSATHEAHAALRMIPTMVSVGEAAGMAAAWAARENVLPGEIDGEALKARLRGR
jgi:hypothetical protein